ncbi:MAG: hypothetical protein EDQ89_11170, partial [Acidobacteria bacterium]
LRDRALATTTRISALAAPLNPGVTEGYVDPQISADGNTVAFAGTSGQAYAVANGAGRRISANAAGTFGNGTSANPFPTSNGALVFFDSTATNLLSGSDGNGATGDISIKRFSGGRARIDVALSEPVDLLRELEESCDLDLRVRSRSEGEIVLDVAG